MISEETKQPSVKPSKSEPSSLPRSRTGRPGSFEQHRRSAGASNRKFIAAGAVIVIAAVAIVVVAMQGSSVYYVTVAEFNAKGATVGADAKEIKVAGKVVPNTIVKKEAGQGVEFTARDKDNPSQLLKVVYTNKILPDTFKDDAEVVVTGTYQNGFFTASEMLAKCPSKYSSSAADASK